MSIYGNGHDIMRDGLTLGGIDKMKAEWFERTQMTPEQVYGQDFPEAAWRLVHEELKRRRKKMSQDSSMRGDCEIAMATAKIAYDGMSPWDALVLQADSCIEHYGRTRPYAQMLLREACYKVLNEEFIGRQVG